MKHQVWLFLKYCSDQNIIQIEYPINVMNAAQDMVHYKKNVR